MDDMKKGKANVRPKMRPKSVEKQSRMKKVRPKMRPEIMGGMGESTRGQNPRDAMGEEGLKQMLQSQNAQMPESMGMKNGGAVSPYAKPKDVDKSEVTIKTMKSGGKIRGYGKARGGKACKMR